MASYEDNAPALNDQAVLPFCYPINHQSKRYFLRDDSVNHPRPPLLPEEIIEQCLALVDAILNAHQENVRESLTLILEERLLLLKKQLH